MITCPVPDRTRLSVEGVDPAVAAEDAEIVANPADADLAVLRLDIPFDPRTGLFESF